VLRVELVNLYLFCQSIKFSNILLSDVRFSIPGESNILIARKFSLTNSAPNMGTRHAKSLPAAIWACATVTARNDCVGPVIPVAVESVVRHLDYASS
jgi:hypothetical protein